MKGRLNRPGAQNPSPKIPALITGAWRAGGHLYFPPYFTAAMMQPACHRRPIVSSGLEEDALQIHLERLRIRGEAQPVGLADLALLDEAVEILVERLRAGVAARFEQLLDLVVVSVEDQVADRGIGDEDFVRGEPSATLQGRDELLANETAQRPGDLPAGLLDLLRWEKLKETRQRLLHGGGVHGRDDQVARFGGGDRRLEGFLVAHFTDQDDVGVLAQDGLDRQLEARHVEADLALLK